MATVDADTVAAALNGILDKADWSSVTERAIKAQLKQELGAGITRHIPLIKVSSWTPPPPHFYPPLARPLHGSKPRPRADAPLESSLRHNSNVSAQRLIEERVAASDAATVDAGADKGKRTAASRQETERPAKAARTAGVRRPAHGPAPAGCRHGQQAVLSDTCVRSHCRSDVARGRGAASCAGSRRARRPGRGD